MSRAILSLHLPGLSSIGDICVESGNSISISHVIDTEEEHTLTAFGDISFTEEQIQSTANRPLGRLRLKVKRPPFPKKRIAIQEVQRSPTTPTSPFSSAMSPALFFEALRNLRSDKRPAGQRSQSDAVESVTPSGPRGVEEPASRECPPTSSNTSSNTSNNYRKPVQSVIVTPPSVVETPEQSKGWSKLPVRLPHSQVGCH